MAREFQGTTVLADDAHGLFICTTWQTHLNFQGLLDLRTRLSDNVCDDNSASTYSQSAFLNPRTREFSVTARLV